MLTYHEAVEAGAEAIDSHEESTSHGDETRRDTCGEVIDGFDLNRDQASHQARAVLEAVGYADLLAEVENLHITVREDGRVMDRDAIEVERLRARADCPVCRVVNAQRARLAAERDALAATVARVEALADEWAGGNNESIHAAYELRAALHPEVS